MKNFDFPENYVVVDIETTGLRAQSDSIIEISAIKYINGKKAGEFSELINPEKNGITPFIMGLTGITYDMVKNARDELSVLKSFDDFVGDYKIVGHNVKFDISFIDYAFKNRFNKAFDNEFIDTLKLSRSILKHLKHHKLKDLAKYYEIDYNGAHRALRDCEITNQCLERLREDCNKDSLLSGVS